MKKLILCGVAMTLFFSCQVTERMYLSESGMVRQESELDFTSLMAFAYTPEARDSLRNIGEFPIDTIVSLADSNQFTMSNGTNEKAQAEFAKAFTKSKMRYVMNDEESKFITFTEEMSVDSFNAYQKNIRTALIKYEQADELGAANLAESGLTNVLQYKLSAGSFERTTLNKAYPLDNMLTDSTGISAKEMLNMSEYKIEYHFPKAVKSTTLKNAEISADGKTVTASVGMNDILEDPGILNFKVEFK